MIIEPTPGDTLGRIIGRIFFDSWIAMLAAGALAIRLHQPVLSHFGYWDWVLGIILIQALSPTHPTKWRIKLPDMVNVLMNDHRRRQGK